MRVAVIGVGLIGGLHRDRGARAPRAPRSRAGTPTRRRSTPPRRAAPSTAAPSLAAAVDGRLGRLRRRAGRRAPVGRRGGARRPPGGLRGHRRRLDEGARSSSTTRASAAGTRSPGRRRRASANARGDLFEGAVWYLTPTPRTSGILLERLHRVVAGFGARPLSIDAETHDRVMAGVSHLPHVLANVLVAQAAAALGGEAIPPTGPVVPRRDPRRRARTARSGPTSTWPTATRWSSGSTRRSRGCRRSPTRLRAGDPEAVTAWNEAAAADRRALLEAGLEGGTVLELRASVPNRPGVIADIALALGRAGVNIVDMALSPSADFRQGRVSLWVSGDEHAARAEELIAGLGFPVARA